MEIIIGGVTASVALCAQGCAEYNEVLGYGSVDDVHGAHCPAGIVEDPLAFERRDLLRVFLLFGEGEVGAGVGVVGEWVRCDVGAVGFLKASDDVVGYAGGGIGV